MRILIHDFAGHPFQVQLSRSLAKKGYSVLHVYSQSIQTPKGNLKKNNNDSDTFNIIGIIQKNTFPKYAPIERWISEKRYANKIDKILSNFRPDIVISANTPLDIQKHLVAYCNNRNIQFIFWVQDIYSAAVKLVLNRKLPLLGTFISFYYKHLERNLLSKSDNVVVISDDFRAVLENWIDHHRITVIENWAPLDEIFPQSKLNSWSAENGFSDKFCFMYAGTLGMKHNPDSLLHLARRFNNDKETAIIVISEGIGAEWLKDKAHQKKINNLYFFEYIEFKNLRFALSTADVLIAILDKDAGTFCVPSKVLTYHCIGKPILLSVPLENNVARIVQRQNSGFVTDSMDTISFCQSAERLRNDADLGAQMGINARNYAENAFNIEHKCDSFIQLFS